MSMFWESYSNDVFINFSHCLFGTSGKKEISVTQILIFKNSVLFLLNGKEVRHIVYYNSCQLFKKPKRLR